MKRVITLASFPTHVTGGEITLEPGDSPWEDTNPALQKDIRIPTVNYSDENMYVFQIDLCKDGGSEARLRQIEVGGTIMWKSTPPGIAISTDYNKPTPFSFLPNYFNMVAGGVLDGIELQSTNEVEEIWWYVTFHYSRQTDLSDPETSTMKFFVTLR